MYRAPTGMTPDCDGSKTAGMSTQPSWMRWPRRVSSSSEAPSAQATATMRCSSSPRRAKPRFGHVWRLIRGKTRSCEPRASSPGRSGCEEDAASINFMRFPVVLFDLDGTVIDSGAIILASMRHVAKEVLGAEVPDEELMAAVGGPGLEAQMHALAADKVDELVDVYRAHNE